MEAVPCKLLDGKVSLVEVREPGESAEAESVRNDKGITGVGLFHLDLGFLEVGNQLCIDSIDLGQEAPKHRCRIQV